MLTLTVFQIDWIMNLWNENVYVMINKETTKKDPKLHTKINPMTLKLKF